MASGGAGFGVGIATVDSNWTFVSVLQAHFVEICHAFSYNGENNVNGTNNLSSCDSSEISASIIAIGLVGCLADFGSFLLESCVLDLFIVMAFTILRKAGALVEYSDLQRCSMLQQTSSVEQGDGDEDPARVFAMYRRLCDISYSVERALGTMFRAMQFRNLLLSVYFIHELLLGPKNGLFFLISHRVAKMILGYYYCISITNKVTRHLNMPFKSYSNSLHLQTSG